MYPAAASALLALLCFWIVDGLPYNGKMTITQSGATKTVNVAGGNCGVTVSGSSLSLAQNCAPRVELLTTSGSFYRLPNMLGKSIQYTVDVSDSTCGCNAALYFFEAPSTATADYYCDAQCPNGLCCNEIDIMEANAKAFQTTVHCNAGTTACKWGCAINWKAAASYGAGSSYKIDTRSPFTVIASFYGSGTTLKAIHIKLVQGTKSISGVINDDSCTSLKSGYITGLSSAITGGKLVVSISYWHGSMSWLDGCSSDTCSTSSTNLHKISGIKILDSLAAIGEDESTGYAISAAAPALYAVVVLGVVVVVLAIIVVVVVVIKKSGAIETV